MNFIIYFDLLFKGLSWSYNLGRGFDMLAHVTFLSSFFN